MKKNITGFIVILIATLFLSACADKNDGKVEATAVPPTVPSAIATEAIVPEATIEVEIAETAVTENTELAPVEETVPEIWHPIKSLGIHLIGDVDISPDGNTALLGAVGGYMTIVNLNDLSTREIFFGGNGTIKQLYFLPDSQHFIVGNTFAPPVLIDGLTREIVQTFPSLNANPLALSADGTKLAGLDGGLNAIEIWDIATNQRLTKIEGRPTRMTSLAFSPDGTRLVSTDLEDVNAGATVWDVATGEQIMFLPHEYYPETAAYSPDGRYIATGEALWDAQTGERLNDINIRWGYAFVEFSPDSKLLAVVGGGGSATVVDIATWQPLFETVIGSNTGNLADFSPDGQNLLLGSQLLDVRSGSFVQELGGHNLAQDLGGNNYEFVSAAAISPDGQFAITAGIEEDIDGDGYGEQTIKVWNIDSGEIIHNLAGGDYPIIAAAFSPDGTKLLTNDEAYLRMWDMVSGNEILTTPHLSNYDEELVPIGFISNGTRFFTINGEDILTLYDAATGEVLQNYDHNGAEITTASMTLDGKTAVTGSETVGDAFIRLWDVETGEMLNEHPLGISMQINAIAISPDGSQFISLENNVITDDPTILRVWDTTTAEELNAFTLDGESVVAAYFPDGRQLLVSGEDETIIIDTMTGDLVEQITENGVDLLSGIEQVAISENGKRILLGRSPLIFEKESFAPLTANNVGTTVAEPTPVATDEPSSTAPAAVSVIANTEIFSLPDANNTPLAGAYSQVNYYGMFDMMLGDLGCYNISFDLNEGEGFFEEAYPSLNGSENTFFLPKKNPDLYDRLTHFSCDWQAGDALTVQLTTPSGEVLEESFTYGDDVASRPADSTGIHELIRLADDPYDDGELKLAYTPGPENPAGDYTFSITGNGRTIQHTFTVEQATGPRVFPTMNQPGYQFWHLDQFSPQEEITVVAYAQANCVDEQPTYYETDMTMVHLCLRGWQTFNVDENGRLSLQSIPSEEFVYYAITSEQSGTFPLDTFINSEVIEADYLIREDWLPLFSESIDPNTPSYRLQPGSVVRVIGQSGAMARVQLQDGTEGWVSSAAINKSETAVTNNNAPTVFDGKISDLPEWVTIPAGTFYMGSSSFSAEYTEAAEQPEHPVTLSEFWIQRTEVSNAEYGRCVDAGICTAPSRTGSVTRANYFSNPDFADYPIIYVTHDQAETYCDWIDGRLPTEAEWERAARIPHHDYYTWGEMTSLATPQTANFDKNAGDTTAVTEYLATAPDTGLVNLHGNVWEWTADWFDANYYQNSPENNPTGPVSGNEKIARGGSWSTSLEFLSLTNRFNRNPNQGYDNLGIRCVSTTNPNNS